MKNLPVVTEFTVDRGKWGMGSLLRDNGNMCAIGFYARACGYDDEDIRRLYLEDVEIRSSFLPMVKTLRTTSFSDLAINVWEINDGPSSLPVKEKKLTELFASIGVTVKFEG